MNTSVNGYVRNVVQMYHVRALEVIFNIVLFETIFSVFCLKINATRICAIVNILERKGVSKKNVKT